MRAMRRHRGAFFWGRVRTAAHKLCLFTRKMENWRLADPEYTDFEPKTVGEAIMRFRRLQKRGLTPWMYPECFIKCAAKLPPAELDKFESWIINPTGEPPSSPVKSP